MPSRPLLALAALLLPCAAGAQASATDSSANAITLEQAVALAQGRGLAADAARQSLVAARHRDDAFDARFMPRLALTSTALDVNRGFTQIRLPTGESRFVRQSDNMSWMQLGVVQPLPWTGTEISLGSRLERIDQFGDGTSTQTWRTTPFVLGLRQSFFRPRALVWDRREQDLGAVAAERQYLEAREDVASQTASAFFDVYAAQVQVDNAANNAAVNDTLYTLNTGRYEVGKIGENDLLQSELALLRARASLDGARLELDRTRAALRRLLRLPPDAPVAAATPPVAPAVVIDTGMAVTQALANASALPQAELQITRTRRAVAQARSDAGFRADVQASLGFNQTAPDFSTAYESPQSQQSFTMQVEMPLVQWGAGRAAVAAARAEQSRAEGLAQARREEVAEEARFAARQLMQAQRQLAISAKADTVAAKRFEVAKNRYVIGRIGINDLYVAQNEKDQAVLSYVQALRGYWAAHYRLRRLTLYDFETGAAIRAEP
jgi:outer membrane protein TolC